MNHLTWLVVQYLCSCLSHSLLPLHHHIFFSVSLDVDFAQIRDLVKAIVKVCHNLTHLFVSQLVYFLLVH